MTLAVFVFFAVLTLVPAIAILLNRNVLYSAFFLLLSLLGFAGLYVLAAADFLAVAQLVVYVGGILVLIIFGVMFTAKQQKEQKGKSKIMLGVALAGGIGALLSYLIALGLPAAEQVPRTRLELATTTIPEFGRLLMTEYILAFELAAILLLMALVAAAHIAGKNISEES